MHRVRNQRVILLIPRNEMIKCYVNLLCTCFFCFQSKPSYLVPWMASCCFFILIAVVSYVIKIVAYIEAGNTTLSAICVVGAILNVCKYCLY